MSTELKPKQLVANGVFALAGACLILLTSYIGEWGYVTMLMGLTFAIMALLKTIVMVLHVDSVKKLAKDKRGVAWVWGVAGLAILFCPIVYWAIGYPFSIIEEQMLGMYTLTGNMALAWTAAKVFISYILALVLFFVMVWSFVNARNHNQ